MNEWTEILTGLVKHDTDGGYRVSLSGEPDANAIVAATGAIYRKRHPEWQTQPESGQKVTILRHNEGAFGHGSILAMSGTVFEGNKGLGILPKGKRRNGYSLQGMIDADQLLDVVPGYNREPQLQDLIDGIRADLPALSGLTQDDLNALPSRGKNCTLAVFGTYPFYTGQVPGTIWLCHSYLKGDDIVENVMFIDPSSEGFSEHGSCYGKDLLRMQVGKVVDFSPISFKDALDLTNADDAWEQALRLLAGAK